MRHEARQPHRVHPDPTGSEAPACAGQHLGTGRIGIPLPRGGGHAVRRHHGGARGGVRLGVVMQFDHLGALEQRRRQLCEAHHQHRGEGEIGRDDAVAAIEESGEARQVLLGESGRADHGVDALHRQAGQVLPGRGQHREVHADLHARRSEGVRRCGHGHAARIAGGAVAEQPGHGLAGRRGIHRGHELHVPGGRHRGAHGAPHASGGAEYADPDHDLTAVRPYRGRNPTPPTPAARCPYAARRCSQPIRSGQFRRRRGPLGASAGPRSPKSEATIRSNSSAKETSSIPVDGSGAGLSDRDA